MRDSDHDGVMDGNEDRDHDMVSNEDEDDATKDRCSGDRNRNGQADEDEGDRFGTITSFDAATKKLVVTSVSGAVVTVVVTMDTEIEFDGHGDSNENGDGDTDDATTAALVAGAGVAELEIDRKTGELEEIELIRA